METQDEIEWTKEVIQRNEDEEEEEEEVAEEEDHVPEDDADEIIELDDGESNVETMEEDFFEDDRDDVEFMEDDLVEGESDGKSMENDDDLAQLVFDRHQEPVYAVACHPTLPYAISGGGDDRSYLWHITEGRLIHEHEKKHTDSVVSVGFNFDGHYYATAGMDCQLFVYETAHGKEVAAFEASDEILWLDWHPRGNVVVAGTQDGQLWLWNLRSLMHVFHGPHVGPVHAGQFTPDGKHLVSGGEEGSFVVWDPHTAQPILKYTSSHDQRWLQSGVAITALRVHPTQPVALVGASDGKVKLVHLQQCQLLASFDAHSMSIECIQFSPTLVGVAAVGSVDGSVSLLDLTHTCVRGKLVHPDAVPCLAFPAAGTSLVTSCMDGRVRVYDPRSLQLLKTLSGHHLPILALALSPPSIHGNTALIVSGSDDGTCRVFSLLDE